MKIIDYAILDGKDDMHLEKVVNEYIRDGWQPQGGPYTEYGSNRHYQAVVKYEEVKKS